MKTLECTPTSLLGNKKLMSKVSKSFKKIPLRNSFPSLPDLSSNASCPSRYSKRIANRQLRTRKSRKENIPQVIYQEHDYKLDMHGEIFHNRYRYTGVMIGRGSFGQVIEAVDMTTKQRVAIKIIKSKKSFTSQAQTEIELLQYLESKNNNNQYAVVRLLDRFFHHGHQCLVFECLSYNLYEVLRKTSFRGVSLNTLRAFAWQIVQVLEFLAKPDVSIIHCDLKPENILLVQQNQVDIKVIDFGSSCKSNKRLYSYIQSRFYRSPEVLLGLRYTVAIDMWSLGCILAEMHIGEPLFCGDNKQQQMAQMVSICGLPPANMISNAPEEYRKEFFQELPNKKGPQYRLKDTPGRKKMKSTCLAEVLHLTPHHLDYYTPSIAQHYFHFLDLVQQMLEYTPERRITPSQALRHPFLQYATKRTRYPRACKDRT